jgi:hypothetical protein
LIKNIKNIKLLKPENVFSSRTIHALYLVSTSKLTPENVRLKLMLSVKEIYQHSNIHQIKTQKVSFLKAKLSRLERQNQEYLNEENFESYKTTNFAPSKSALNILNFIDKFEENKLRKIDCDEDIVFVFRIIYILLNRDTAEHPIKYLFDNLVPSMRVSSLSIEN